MLQATVMVTRPTLFGPNLIRKNTQTVVGQVAMFADECMVNSNEDRKEPFYHYFSRTLPNSIFWELVYM